MKTCEICGRQLRTGKKYCYRHRNYADHTHTTKKTNDDYSGIILIGGLLLFICLIVYGIYIFIHTYLQIIQNIFMWFGVISFFFIIVILLIWKLNTFIIFFNWLSKRKNQHFKNESIEKNQEKIEPIIKKAQLTTCWSCNCTYSFTANLVGDTVVQCPNCGNKGVIK